MERENQKKSILSKTKSIIIHVGFWSAVSTALLINSFLRSIPKEKMKNDHFDE